MGRNDIYNLPLVSLPLRLMVSSSGDKLNDNTLLPLLSTLQELPARIWAAVPTATLQNNLNALEYMHDKFPGILDDLIK